MAAPAAAIAAKAAARAAGAEALKRMQPRLQPPPPPKDGRGTLKALIAIGVIVVLLPALIVAVLLGGAQQNADCAPAGEIPGTWTGPGSLGGVAGTGVTRAELAAARRIPGVGGTRLTAGTYSPTAYFPNPHAPPTNCSSTCSSTASGIRIDNATRRAYLIASNPQLNQYGALAYIWPNPYGWSGPFVVADTGSDFHRAGRLDFYVFIDTGQTWQQALAKAYQWGPANQVTLSAAPISPGGPTIAASPLGIGPADLGPGGTPPPLAAPAAPSSAPAAGACGSPVAPGSLGELTGTPEQIVNRVVLYAHDHGFPAVTPASVRAANDAHSILTTSGNQSDHKGPPDVAWAADISNGTTTREEDELARTLAAAFELTWPGGGLVSGGSAEYRIQLIYRTCGGGDHFTHVHIGIKREPGPRPSVVQTAYGRPGCV